MKKSDQAAVLKFAPLGRLRPKATFSRGVLLAGEGGIFKAEALASDLFRIRISSRQELAADHSWAVVKNDWPPLEPNWDAAKGILRTSEGELEINFQTGDFVLRDRFGFEVFKTSGGETGFSGEMARITFDLREREQVFGLGETSGTFNKRGLLREFWNIDVLGHSAAIHPSLRSLYISIPFAIFLRDGRAGGIFWDNTSRQSWDIGQTRLDKCKIEAAHGEINVYLFLGPDIREIVRRFSELTGRMQMPPKWVLGYQQCRYSYETRARVQQLARDFRTRRIPCDVIYLDIHYMDEYRVFTFGKTFPSAAGLIRKLRRDGFKVVTIVDPGVKDDRNFGVWRRGRRIKGFVRDLEGKKDYVGKVWPGPSRFPDFTSAKVRSWWAEEQFEFQHHGIAGFWNDMNEPADFAGPGKTLPEKCVHNTDFGPQEHSVAHNVYGMQMARASQLGALRFAPRKRPFIISRAGYAGIQRYALVWTGDNSSWWEHLADAVQMFLNLGISGVPFCGGDIGGFLDNTTGELLARWTQFATFTPFFRNHSNIRTHDQEPWSYGPEIEAICKRYIEHRYQLLPYLYCLFAEAHLHGVPIMRPMFWQFQNDQVAACQGDQFMLGDFMLVAPILRQGARARSVYLPAGQWYDFWSGHLYDGGQHVVAPAELDTIPVFVRAGAILPFGPVQQYVGENEVDWVTLNIWPGRDGELNWHEDDGESNDYEAGGFCRRKISWKENHRSLVFEKQQGSFAPRTKSWRIIVHNISRRPKIKLNGKTIPSEFAKDIAMLMIEISNLEEKMEINL